MNEKSPLEADAMTVGECIALLKDLQERTRLYPQLFPECGEEANKAFAALDKQALEMAIQALLALDEQRRSE